MWEGCVDFRSEQTSRERRAAALWAAALFRFLFLYAALRRLRGLCRGAAPAPRHLLKKVDENFFLLDEIFRCCAPLYR